ncbi:CPK29 [Symbiodinium microadriaticum]|nr:CPK29 [Symbiodinium microadriaticum]
MLESHADDTPVKIIDLGMMVHLPAGAKKYFAEKISGTRGYLAPESILKKEYSAASDVWQVGCVLYTMLSGMLPFHPSHLDQAVLARYYAMTGPSWEKICGPAKDLVKRLLVREPQWRLSLQEVLQHEWMQADCAVSDKDLGEDYARRIKKLALRQKMRNFFMLNEELLTSVRLKRDHITELLPFLKVRGRARYPTPVHAEKPAGIDDVELLLPQMVDLASLRVANQGAELPLDVISSPDDPLVVSTSPGVSPRMQPLSRDLSVRTFKLRLHNIHEMIVSNDDNGSEDEQPDQLESVDEEANRGSSEKVFAVRKMRSFSLPPEEIDYENFVTVLTKAGLQGLATPRVFDLFDIGSKGTINLRQFLLTMLAVQPSHVEVQSPDTFATSSADPLVSDEDDFVRMFFSIFDIDNNGSINREEFALALQHLDDITPQTAPLGDEQGTEGYKKGTLLEGSAQHTAFLANVEELFQEMDVDKSGKIDFGEFKRIYCEALSLNSLAPPGFRMYA